MGHQCLHLYRKQRCGFANPHTNAYTDCCSLAHANTNTNADPDCDGYCSPEPDTNAYTGREPNTDGNGYRSSESYADSYEYSNAHSDFHTYPDDNVYSYGCAEPNANANTDRDAGIRSRSNGQSGARIDIYFFNRDIPVDGRQRNSVRANLG